MTTRYAPFVSISRAARELGLSVPQLRRMADAGRVPFTLTEGGHRRFNTEDVRLAMTHGDQALAAESSSIPLDALPAFDRTLPLAGLEESEVWADAVAQIGLRRDSGAYQVFHYALTEMVNNAIDHSEGTAVRVLVWSGDPIVLRVEDDGVGAFQRLREALALPDDASAALELSKGKATSDPARHSGEGIFFTSRAVDRFRLEANGLAFSVDAEANDWALGVSSALTGTTVTAAIDPDSERSLPALIAEFTDEKHRFSRTHPVVRLAQTGQTFVSRSEAKRLVARLEQFEEVVLDFAGVDEVGQAFADEVFRVWPSFHPETRIDTVNMNPIVEFMVKRAIAAR